VRGVLTLFERVLLVVLLLLAIEASRGIPWFVFFALATVPTMLNRVSSRELRLPSSRAAAGLLAASSLAVVAASAVVVTKRHGWVTASYPPSAARATAAAAGSTSKVFANGAYSDWLLLLEPSLRGRVAYDARFELLPDGRLADAAAVSIGRSDWRRILAPFDVVVLRPQENELRHALIRDGRWRRIATDSHVVVFRRAAQ
jgi:hypothetical protein